MVLIVAFLSHVDTLHVYNSSFLMSAREFAVLVE
jgi:hypothetical protein